MQRFKCIVQMKYLFASLLILITCNSYAQEIKLFEHRNQIVSITDTINNYRIVVDSSHLYISVYNKQNALIWKNYTEVCNYCSNCKEPKEILTIELKPIEDQTYTKKQKPEMGIFVDHCICWGYFELKTGNYVGLGCD